MTKFKPDPVRLVVILEHILTGKGELVQMNVGAGNGTTNDLLLPRRALGGYVIVQTVVAP